MCLSGRAKYKSGIRLIKIFVLCLLPAALFAENVDDAELVWRQVLGGAAITKPAAQLDSVVIVCEGGLVKAFGKAGGLLWEYKAGGRLQPFISRSASGASYICRTNGLFLAINRSGRLLWQVNLKEGLAAPPLTGWDDRVFIFLSKRLLCFTASGTRLWQLELESPLVLPPVPDKSGGFAAVLENKSFIRVNAFGQLYAVQLDDIPRTLLPLPPETDGRPPQAALYSNGVLEFIREDGAGNPRRFLTRFPSPPITAAERDGLLAALLTNGDLTLFSPEHGILWSVRTALSAAGNQNVEINWDEEEIYVLSQNGGEGYNLNGRRLWNMRLLGSAAMPVIYDGILYSSGKDWIFYAYRVEGKEKPSAAQGLESYNLKTGGDYGLGKAPSYLEAQNLPRSGALTDILDKIETCVRHGNIGVMEPLYTKILLAAAGGAGLGAENINQRLKAISLLGRAGSREIIPFLTGLFRRDKNIQVKSAAAQAIGAIGVDPDGRALAAFAEFIAAPHTYSHERLLSNLAVSIGSLCRFSGPPLSRLGIPLLISLTDHRQPKSARQRAGQELSLLYGK
ncbi:MAG: PQQ-binding-like beta-propeller repeat protein [Spirochaetaceae bacterium]|jgi:outer membrane protein assembly factor BamB|nr:PQQ-binding-like beta-propeller repeat protein [Spirochaetaceae bacterium]